MVKNLPTDAGDTRDVGSFPGLGRSPGVGNGNSLQYSWLEKSMDRRAWRVYNQWGYKELAMTEWLGSSFATVNLSDQLWFPLILNLKAAGNFQSLF